MFDEEVYEVVNSTAQEDNEQEIIDELCWKVFVKSKDGRELIKRLKEFYIINQGVANDLMRARYGEHYVGFREGQNDMIRELIQRTNIYIKSKEPK